MRNLPYTLRIGVIGHQHLAEAKPVTEAVERVLRQMETVFAGATSLPWGEHGSRETWVRRCDRLLVRVAVRPILRLCGLPVPIAPQKTPIDRQTRVAWTVISTLATGADRLVARRVLARSDAKLQVVLPKKLRNQGREIEHDTAADQAEYEQLLALDPAPTVLDADSTPRSTSEETRRDAQEAAERYVVHASEIVIAVWDGLPTRENDRTVDIIRYAIDRGRYVVWINVSDPDAAPRWMQGPTATGTPGPLTGMSHTALPSRARQWSLGFHRLAAFQRDPTIDARQLDGMICRQRSELWAMAERARVGQAAVEPVLAQLLPHYVRADQLAADYQNLYVFAAKSLFRLSAVAVTVAVAQVLFFPDILWLVILEIGAMLAALVLLRASRREAWHEKWLNDRHLAEWLRTSMFASLVGPHRDSRAAPEAARLPFYQGADHWFVDTFLPLVEDACRRVPARALEPLKRFLVEHWIRDQANWHRRNAGRKRHIAHGFHRYGMWLFGATLVMAMFHGLGIGHAAHESSAELHAVASTTANVATSPAGHVRAAPSTSQRVWEGLGKIITFLAIVLPAWGASSHGVATLLDYDRIAARSHHMANCLDSLATRAGQAATLAELRSVVARTEELMAAENQEWLASLSFRGLVLPA